MPIEIPKSQIIKRRGYKDFSGKIEKDKFSDETQAFVSLANENHPIMAAKKDRMLGVNKVTLDEQGYPIVHIVPNSHKVAQPLAVLTLSGIKLTQQAYDNISTSKCMYHTLGVLNYWLSFYSDMRIGTSNPVIDCESEIVGVKWKHSCFSLTTQTVFPWKEEYSINGGGDKCRHTSIVNTLNNVVGKYDWKRNFAGNFVRKMLSYDCEHNPYFTFNGERFTSATLNQNLKDDTEHKFNYGMEFGVEGQFHFTTYDFSEENIESIFNNLFNWYNNVHIPSHEAANELFEEVQNEE